MKKNIQLGAMGFTSKIMLAMFLGILFGSLLKLLPHSPFIDSTITYGVLEIGGRIFIATLKMLVVPLVFVSLVCGTCQISDTKKLGNLALKTILMYILTTAIAVAVAIILASIFHIGSGLQLSANASFEPSSLPSLKDTLVDIFPSNPIQAMSEGNMLQIIVFALLFGYAISISGKSGRHLAKFFNDCNTVIMKLVFVVLWFAPYGVFCLLAKLFASEGLNLIGGLIGYFFTVLTALFVQWAVVYGLFLKLLARVNPLIFFKKLYAAMLFAFSVSSSSASIPVVMDTAENKLGIHNSVASFVIPLGATINMDGTSIMQGVATVFIAHVYGIDIGLIGYLMVILTATLASIGTAGIPSVGLITLTMVLQQVGLPVEGISLIIGIDRLLDMTRTAVNISGDCMVSLVVAKSQREFNQDIYNSTLSETTTTAAQMKNWHR